MPKATTPAVIQPTGPVIILIDVASLGNTTCKPPIKLPASLAINDILPREPANAPNVVNIPPVTVTNLPNIVSSGPTVTKVIASHLISEERRVGRESGAKGDQ